MTGATLAAARAVWSGQARRGASIAGGMHHAMAANASGFGVYHDVEAAPLSPGASAGEPATWFSSVHAGAAQTRISIAVQPVPGGARFTCQRPVGFRR